MDKSKRQKRFEQKCRNGEKWKRRVHEKMRVSITGLSTKQIYEWEQHQIHLLRNHGKVCSCLMCRNPRRTPYKEVTIQEKRADELFKSFIEPLE